MLAVGALAAFVPVELVAVPEVDNPWALDGVRLSSTLEVLAALLLPAAIAGTAASSWRATGTPARSCANSSSGWSWESPWWA